jgi:hypothetical protein
MAKYVLMFVEDLAWKKQPMEAKREAYAAIEKWWDDLMKRGALKGGTELQPADTAITVRRVNGTMKVSDGPFIESKEQVGGFGMIEAADLDEAIAIAKTWPGYDVEVRPVVER